MVYVVERYLPGLSHADLLPGLSKLTPALEELREQGSAVRYLGSTIVLGDEACFCEFEASSAAAVADANRMAGLPFHRIVPAVLVQSDERRSEMSVSPSISRTARLGRSRQSILIVAVAAVIAAATWAIASQVGGSGGHSAARVAPTQASALRSLTPAERQYVAGIASLTSAQIRAAFGTALAEAAPISLTARERRYVDSVSALTARQLAAAFGEGR
jgi:hypothetical protein